MIDFPLFLVGPLCALVGFGLGVIVGTTIRAEGDAACAARAADAMDEMAEQIAHLRAELERRDTQAASEATP